MVFSCYLPNVTHFDVARDMSSLICLHCSEVEELFSAMRKRSEVTDAARSKNADVLAGQDVGGIAPI